MPNGHWFPPPSPDPDPPDEEPSPETLPDPNADPPAPAPTKAAPAPKKPRGFAAMNTELVRQIAKKGGKAAHLAGTAHEFTKAEAREAGKKGGKTTFERRKARET